MLSLEERRRKRRLAQQQRNEDRRQQLMKKQEKAEAKANIDATSSLHGNDGPNSEGHHITTTSHDGNRRNVDKTSQAIEQSSFAWLSAKNVGSNGAAASNSMSQNESTKCDTEEKDNLTYPSERSSIVRPPLTARQSMNSGTTQAPSQGLRHVLTTSYSSPQSSVSYSQDVSTKAKLAALDSPAFVDLSENKVPPCSAVVAASQISRKRRPRARSESSSSDESFDILKLAEIKERGLEENSASNGDALDHGVKVAARGKSYSSLSGEGCPTQNDLDTHDSKQRAPEQSCSHSSKSDQAKSEHASSDEVSFEKPSKHRDTSARRAPRNPLTLMKEDQSIQPHGDTKTKNLESDIVDDMWADIDDTNEAQDDESTKGLGQRKKRKQNKGQERPKKKKTRTDSKYSCSPGDKLLARAMLVGLDNRENLTDESDGTTESLELKPQFDHPKFGPFELEALVLASEEAEEPSYQVPASMARYLPCFQREGIEFAFNAITTRQGAILGHDMGLGKTIQTVSLAAALLGKTGTMKDLIDIRRRMKALDEKKQIKQDAIDQALRSGEVYTDPFTQQLNKRSQCKWAPILVMAPSSVLNNWITTFSEWGHFAITSYENGNNYSGLDSIVDGLAEILIVSHSIFMMAQHFEKLAEVPWKLAVIDEFHLFKNEKAIRSVNIRALKAQHDTCILGLTGTLMQNDHKELWNLVDIVAPNVLGTWTYFEREIGNPIKFARTKDATKALIELGQRKKEALQRKLDTIHHRKTKESVLKDLLPRKDERIVFCDPSPLQKAIIKHILKQPDFVLVGQAHTACTCGANSDVFKQIARLRSRDEKIDYFRKHKNNIIKRSDCCFPIPTIKAGGTAIDPRAILWRQMHPNDTRCERCPFCIIFPAMQYLFKVATHIGLIQPQYCPETLPEASRAQLQAKKDLELIEVFVPPALVGQLPGGSLIRQDDIMNDHFALSGKMKVLAQLLKIIERRDGRVLLFSASTSTLDLIETFVCTTGYSFLRMDGSTPQRKRTELADEFKSKQDIFIFLLSTKAMGLGLNLTSASWVIIFDVEWNPSYDKQAQDRSYRIGQEKDVKVFRLVSSGTIEELRYLRQVYKMQLESETLANPDAGRDTSKRIFRGVAGDSGRRGELFGITNLLRFCETGTFMNYGPEADDARLFNQNMFDMDSFLSVAHSLSTDMDKHDEESAIQAAEQAQSSSRHSKSEKVIKDCTYDKIAEAETQLLGGESQACLNFCREMPGENTNLDDDDERLSESGAQMLGGESQACLEACISIPSEYEGGNPGMVDGKDCNEDVRGTDEVDLRPSESSSERAYRKTEFSTPSSNSRIVGSTKASKKAGIETVRTRSVPKWNEGGVKKLHKRSDQSTNVKTTFSASDLTLPSGSRKKKKKG
ncbi:hypothetical protein ACA910_005063 [Epithemia clementina (nom. ined.)]